MFLVEVLTGGRRGQEKLEHDSELSAMAVIAVMDFCLGARCGQLYGLYNYTRRETTEAARCQLVHFMKS